jgi:hypothetical protein
MLPEQEELEVWPNCSAAILKRTTRVRVETLLLVVPVAWPSCLVATPKS